MGEFSNSIQYLIPENTEIVFSILSHVRHVYLVLLEGEADIHIQEKETTLPLRQEFPIPVWECLWPCLKTKSGCNFLVRGNHYVFFSAQKGILENKLFRIFPSDDSYSFVLEKDIQLQIFPVRGVHPESYITIKSTRGAPEISGYKLSFNKKYFLTFYSTVLLKSSDGEPYSVSVQGLHRKVKLSIVDDHYQICMGAVKEHIFNQCLLGKKFKHISPTVLVLGPKNVGKSSFCQLLVNDALEKRMTPVYVDLNVQRSLSIPGSLSLTEIESRTNSTLGFKYKIQALLHFGYVTFDPVNMPLYHHLMRKMSAMLSHHKMQKYGKKNCLTIIDTIGSRGDDSESIEYVLRSFAVDLVVVMGDQKYYEKLKHSISVPSEFIPKPRNIEPQNDDYKSKYYQYRIQEYFACAIGKHYVENVRTVPLDCFKIYKINASSKVHNTKGERIKDFKLEYMPCNPSMVNRLLAVSAAKSLEFNSIIEVKYYVCFTSIDMASKTANVLAPEKVCFNGGLLLMGHIERKT